MESIGEFVGDNKIMRYLFVAALEQDETQPVRQAVQSRIQDILEPQSLLQTVYHMQKHHLK